MFNSFGSKTFKILGATLTILLLLPLYTIKILTKPQLNTYVELGRGVWIYWLEPPYPYRTNPIQYLFKIIPWIDTYIILYIICLLTIPILSIKIYDDLVDMSIIPLYIYSILIGDLITPILFVTTKALSRGKIRQITETLLIINNPEYGVISPLDKTLPMNTRLWRFIVGIAGLILIQLLNLKNFLFHLYQPILLVIYVTQVLILYLATRRNYYINRIHQHLIFLTSMINPQTLYFMIINKRREIKGRKRGQPHFIILALLIMLLIYSSISIYHSQSTAIERNPGLDEFIKELIPQGATVMTVNLDPTIEGLIRRRAYIVSLGEINYEWDWPDYTQTKKNWELLMDYSREKQIKYLIIEKKLDSPAYWPPPNEFTTYTYYLDPQTERELDIVINKYVVNAIGAYSIQDIETMDEEPNLINQYLHYWSNASEINIDIDKDYIDVEYHQPYVVYLWFKNPYYNEQVGNITLQIRLESLGRGLDNRIRNIEIYVSNTDKLGGPILTISSVNKTLYYLISPPNPQEIINNKYFIFKVEAAQEIRILTLSLIPNAIEDGLEIEWYRDKLILNNGFSSLIISLNKIGDIVDIPQELVLKPGAKKIIPNPEKPLIDYYILLYVFIPLLITLATTYSKEEIWGNDGDKSFIPPKFHETIYITLMGIPLIFLLFTQPEIIKVGWIGGGGFIYYLIMIIPLAGAYIKTIGEEDIFKLLTKLIMIIPIALVSSLLIKYIVVNRVFLETLYTYWHTTSLHISTDYLVYGVAYLIASFNQDRKIRPFSLPPIYLVLYGLLGLLDVTRILASTYLNTILSLNLIIANLFLGIYGYNGSGVTTPYGLNVEIIKDGVRVYDIIIGWPCSGLTGAFLYIIFISIFAKILESSKGFILTSKDKIIILLGIIGIFLLNGFRIAVIIILAINYSVDAGQIFHSTIYDLIFWLYIILIIEILRRRKPITLS